MRLQLLLRDVVGDRQRSKAGNRSKKQSKPLRAARCPFDVAVQRSEHGSLFSACQLQQPLYLLQRY